MNNLLLWAFVPPRCVDKMGPAYGVMGWSVIHPKADAGVERLTALA
ncbi:MAG: hypothetical protein IT327_29855 [Anaerolineae bacterium]|nr:hypothetical protein [Anaerolineae bacterium]